MIKHWRYVLRNIGRNPARTSLTVLGAGVAIFIITYLFTIFDSRNQAVAHAASSVLVVQEKDIY